MLQGNKTYIIAGLMFLYQMIGYFIYAQPVDFMSVLEAAGLAALRAGVKKV